ncbi:MAG: pantetheine-phosphate adenylyltransferase [Bacteroidales bacterium]|nr:pantetheine-phosphate adenylyltransferase [Bacteroidales bacterium]MDE7466453.1 pantetheine-phosphate adenylyltransferase [Muribaculaceae bacterium]
MTPRFDETVLLYAGSFNPFTRGHLRIVERALAIAAAVIVGVGHNPDKPGNPSARERVDEICKALSKLPAELRERVEVVTYTGLTAEFARSLGVSALLRGVRGVQDFEFERNLADVNLKVLGMDTVILCAEPEYSYISSSVIRELASHGHDVSGLLP